MIWTKNPNRLGKNLRKRKGEDFFDSHCMYVRRVFERYPDAKALFSRVNVEHPDSPEFKAHLIRITNALDIIVNLMDDPSVLMKEVEHLANQHVAREGMKGVYITVSAGVTGSAEFTRGCYNYSWH